jgi:hypothetical protein
MWIRVPKFIVSAWAPIGDWINVPIYKDFRRIDVILILAGIFAVSYYWYYGDWRQAIIGGLMYILILMTAVWLR